VAFASLSTPYVHIYERSGTTFTKLSNPGTLPAGVASDLAFSPDGRFLAVAHWTSPYITIYERSGTTFTKLSDPTAPAGNGSCPCWSPDGRFLAVGHATSPYITIYERDDTTFTKLSNPAALPTSDINACAFSPDGRFLMLAAYSTPYAFVYERVNDVFTKLTNPTGLTQRYYQVGWHPNGRWVMVGELFERSGTTFTNYPVSEPGMFSPDGRYLASSRGSTTLTVFSVSGRSLVSVFTSASLSNPYNPSWSPDGRFIAVGSNVTPYVHFYESDASFPPDGGLVRVVHFGQEDT
jgi:WD40 repeat protein